MSKNKSNNKLAIQEGEWIILIPIETGTIKDLAKLVKDLRNTSNYYTGVVLKPNWELKHV